jgi:hypothetical protein
MLFGEADLTLDRIVALPGSEISVIEATGV